MCWLAAVLRGACTQVGIGHALFSGHRAHSVLCLQLFHNSETILAKITNQPESRINKGDFLIAQLLDTYDFFFHLKRTTVFPTPYQRRGCWEWIRGLGKEVDVAKVTQTLGTRELAPGKTKKGCLLQSCRRWTQEISGLSYSTGTTHGVCLS